MLVTLFSNRIINNKNTFSDVPAKLKSQVAEKLIQLGFKELVPSIFNK